VGFTDPSSQTDGATTLQRAAADASSGSRKLTDAGTDVAGACGDSPVGPALDRFTAAWGGELVAWSLGATTLSDVASENGRQMIAATGG